jgi:hypothetical protein
MDDKRLPKVETSVMSIRTEDVYHSSNGDRWQLLIDPSTQQTLVRHVPKASSGGAATEMPADDFLRIDGPGPEFDAIRRALHTWPPVAPTSRSAGFFWVRGPVRPEPAYWDGERWSMLSSVTAEPVVLAETPLRFEDV